MTSDSDPAGEWWETFFSGAWIDVQRGFGAGDKTLAEVDFLADVLAIEPGTDVLDVPCGTGRHAVPLAERGARVTGVDITPTFLDDARAIAEQAKARIERAGGALELVEGDMRALHYGGDFDVAYCMWGSSGFFDDDGQQRFIEGVARALRPSGRFLVEGHVAETLFPVWSDRGWWPLGDAKVIEERRWDAPTGRVEVDWTFLRGDQIGQRHSSIRIYTYRELVTALKGVGFESFEAFAGSQREPFKIGARRLVLVAHKQPPPDDR
jgi:SAM-dependent methyltransferase